MRARMVPAYIGEPDYLHTRQHLSEPGLQVTGLFPYRATTISLQRRRRAASLTSEWVVSLCLCRGER